MKQGEQQAKEILERKGIAFDETHHDNGSKHSLPDLKYLGEERYLEVTHTLHNNKIAVEPNDYYMKSTSEQQEIEERHLQLMIGSAILVTRIQKREKRSINVI